MRLKTGYSYVLIKFLPEVACGKLILAHFPSSQWDVGNREHRPITEKGIRMRVSASIFKISSNFKESNKKLIIG